MTTVDKSDLADASVKGSKYQCPVLTKLNEFTQVCSIESNERSMKTKGILAVSMTTYTKLIIQTKYNIKSKKKKYPFIFFN